MLSLEELSRTLKGEESLMSIMLTLFFSGVSSMIIDSSRLAIREPQFSNFSFSRSIILNFSDILVAARGDDELADESLEKLAE